VFRAIANQELDERKSLGGVGWVIGVRRGNTLLDNLDVAHKTNLLLIRAVPCRSFIGIEALHYANGAIGKPIVDVSHKHDLGTNLQLDGRIDR
jgi:hypothetical protein